MTSSWVGPTPPLVKSQSCVRREPSHLRCDGLDVVHDDDDATEQDAEPPQRAREDGHVGLLDLAREDLVADDEGGRGRQVLRRRHVRTKVGRGPRVETVSQKLSLAGLVGPSRVARMAGL